MLHVFLNIVVVGVAAVECTVLKTRYTNYECSCTCGMKKTDPLCNQCRRVFNTTYGVQSRNNGCIMTCWDFLMSGQNVQVFDGVVHTRNTSCSPWISEEFNKSTQFYTIDGDLFVKNYKLSLLERPEMPPLPPVNSFPGLLAVMNQGNKDMYDNTTCSGRCCKLAVVTRDLVSQECDRDITVCTSTEYGSNIPMCVDDALAPRCMVWIQCKPNDRFDFWIFFVIVFVVWLVLFISSVFVTCGACISCASTSMWIMSAFALLVAFLSIVADSDYSHWAANTLVDKNYASYQSCVTYCNAAPKVGSLVGDKDIAMNMCADGDNAHNPFAVWPANFNVYIDPQIKCASGMTSSLSYCSSCLSVASDWKKTKDAAYYVRVKSYFIVGFWLVFCLVDVINGYIISGYKFGIYQKVVYYVFCWIIIMAILFYTTCFVLSWVFVVPLINNYGEIKLVQDILAFQGGGIPIHDICSAHIAVDLVCGIVFLVSGVELANKMNDAMPYTTLRRHA